MADIKVSVGNKISLRRIQAKDEADRNVDLISKVLEYDGNTNMKIAMPMAKYKNVFLEPDEVCDLYFYSKGGMYGARCSVKDRYYEKNVAICSVVLLTKPEKSQRRQFYRISCMMEVQVHALSREEERTINEININDRAGMIQLQECSDMLAESVPYWDTVMLSDLSGGGIRYFSENERKTDSIELLAMQLKDDMNVREYHVLEKIISCDKNITNGEIRYEIRAQFIKLNERDREQIVRFVFDADRKERQRKSGLDLQ